MRDMTTTYTQQLTVLKRRITHVIDDYAIKHGTPEVNELRVLDDIAGDVTRQIDSSTYRELMNVVASLVMSHNASDATNVSNMIEELIEMYIIDHGVLD